MQFHGWIASLSGTDTTNLARIPLCNYYLRTSCHLTTSVVRGAPVVAQYQSEPPLFPATSYAGFSRFASTSTHSDPIAGYRRDRKLPQPNSQTSRVRSNILRSTEGRRKSRSIPGLSVSTLGVFLATRHLHLVNDQFAVPCTELDTRQKHPHNKGSTVST